MYFLYRDCKKICLLHSRWYFVENRLRFQLDFYPQTALKLSAETQVVFLLFFLEIIVSFDFPLFFLEVLIVVHFDFSLFFPEV